jgi:hypothetical protein
MKYTNTKVHKDGDGSICIWFSPDGNPRVRYFAKGDMSKSRLDGSIRLDLLKKGKDWGDKDTRISWGQANYWSGSFYPFQPLGEQAGVSGLCPPKHQYALLHALDNIPKLKELLK